jgi:hypothetical protein
MVSRTQDRISRLNAACTERTQQLVSTMQEQASGTGHDTPSKEKAAATRTEAVQSVAEALTTPDRPDVG